MAIAEFALRKKLSTLVVGGGLIGSAAARALRDSGHAVSVLTRAQASIDLGSIDWVYGHLDSPRLTGLLNNRDAVVYAAGTVSPATQLESVHFALADVVLPVIKLAEAAGAAGLRKFVFISSGGTVYGPTDQIPTNEECRTAPINLYGTTKVLTEQALLEVGRRLQLSIVILRISNPYGPGQQGTRRLGFIAAAIQAAITGAPITIWGDGTTTRDFVYIEDVSRALALAVKYEGESVILNIGSGRETSLDEICAEVRRTAKVPLEVRFEPGRSVDVARNCLDITRAARVLNWCPRVGLVDGIAQTVASSLSV